MKKVIFTVLLLLVPLFGTEQTICFAQKNVAEQNEEPLYIASLGDEVTLNWGKCKGATLLEMNKKGWELIQVVTGLQSSFGMVFKKTK